MQDVPGSYELPYAVKQYVDHGERKKEGKGKVKLKVTSTDYTRHLRSNPPTQAS